MKSEVIPKAGLLVVVLIIALLSGFGPGFSSAEETVPSIEDLTQGKVKVGDTIDKTNVDLVKEFISPGTYECVQKGMKMIIGEYLPLEKMVPKHFLDATEQNKGKAVIDENGTVFLKDGSQWPGGLPAPDPQTASDVLANLKFGWAADEYSFPNQFLIFNNDKGENYKDYKYRASYVRCTGRMKCEPKGSYPGLENENYRRVAVFLEPLEMKGLGQFSIRYYDDTKDIDTGFAYIPAYKRTLRVSATTYQDNIGGSDILSCDPGLANDPFAYWNFKLVGKKYILTPATKVPFPEDDPTPLSTDDGHPDEKNVQFDNGKKFLRMWWAVTPVHILEATPKEKHVYSKRVLYVPTPSHWSPILQVQVGDIYDRQGKIYK
ncbi:MAG TPA: DUF1329 domain-containing protein, partial [Candidatus Cloacimonadota bacterium]|nr:DUF1329 domain-containing protein [Candidatus Cloacimonadota bacterium]